MPCLRAQWESFTADMDDNKKGKSLQPLGPSRRQGLALGEPPLLSQDRAPPGQGEDHPADHGTHFTHGSANEGEKG